MKRKAYIILLLFTTVLLGSCGDSVNLKEENERLKAEIEMLKESKQTDEITVENDDFNSDIHERDEHEIIDNTEDKVLGEWNTFSTFFSQEEQWNFNADGTGTHLVTMYVHDTTMEISLGDPDDTGIDSYSFNWSFEDGMGRIEYIGYHDQYGKNLDFTIVDQELHTLYENEVTEKYYRDKAIIPEDYITANSVILKQNAHASPVLGQWYFDVFIWTFDPDGTLIIDVPAFGQHPANQLEYSYLLQNDPFNEVDALISIMKTTGEFSMYEAILSNQNGGSLTLQPRSGGNSILLTKSYSLQNSPITNEILDEGMALLDAFEAFSSFGKRR